MTDNQIKSPTPEIQNSDIDLRLLVAALDPWYYAVSSHYDIGLRRREYSQEIEWDLADGDCPVLAFEMLYILKDCLNTLLALTNQQIKEKGVVPEKLYALRNALTENNIWSLSTALLAQCIIFAHDNHLLDHAKGWRANAKV